MIPGISQVRIGMVSVPMVMLNPLSLEFPTCEMGIITDSDTGEHHR